MDKDIDIFWNMLKLQWNNVYDLIINGDEKGLVLLNSFLTKKLSEHIILEATFNEINRQALPAFKNYVELYISPKLQKKNINTMIKMYNTKPKPALPNLLVSCYKAYHIQDPLIEDIKYDNIVIPFKNFGVQTLIGYSEKKKLQLNLVILVEKTTAGYLLEKTKINFKNEEGVQTSRNVWMPSKLNAMDLLLLNIIGEYNYIHNIGYIEYLPEDDPLITNDDNFTELDDIRNHLIQITKLNDYKICNYCNHNELQVSLYKCSVCKNVYYCNKICQKEDYKNHKLVCK